MLPRLTFHRDAGDPSEDFMLAGWEPSWLKSSPWSSVGVLTSAILFFRDDVRHRRVCEGFYFPL